MNKRITYLKRLLDFLEYHNKMAPFPMYDTEYVSAIRKELSLMEKKKEIDYDELPVSACKHCLSLWGQPDDVENDICMRCGAINEVKIYQNIFIYLEAKKEFDEDY